MGEKRNLKESILKLKNEGKTLLEIASILQCNKSSVDYHLNGRAAQKNKTRNILRNKQKTEYANLKGGKCIICGYNKYVGAFAFHHLDPKTKKFEISGHYHSKAEVLEELKKCVLLCANCHAEVEAGIMILPLTFL